MIRVLHILGGMDRGGQETYIMNMFRNMDTSNVCFDFLLHTSKECDYNEEIKTLGGEIYVLPPIYRNPIERFLGLKKLVKQKNYSIVHRHSDKSIESIDLIAAKQANAKTLIYHAHSSSSKYPTGNKMCRRMLNNVSTHRFACSENAAEWVFGEANKTKIEIKNNAIDTVAFSYNEDTRISIRKKLNIENKVVLGHIGRFMPMKNHFFLIDIFEQFQKKISDSVLILVGDGETKNDVEKYIKQKGLSEKILLLGVCSNINDILQSFDVFVFPSIFEGFPVTLIEAQAADLPCVVSNTITQKSLLTKKCVNMPLDNNPDAWAESIFEFVSKKLDRTIESISILSDAGYDVQTVAKELEYFYLSQK